MYKRDNADTVLVNMQQEGGTNESGVGGQKKLSKADDWFMWSVLGYIFFPCIGICAMYYAVRANYAADWGISDALVQTHAKKARCLSKTSIVVGIIFFIIMITAIILMIAAIKSSFESMMPKMPSASEMSMMMGQMGQMKYNGNPMGQDKM